jgi:uncharacterized protein (TIGR00266 family)
VAAFGGASLDFVVAHTHGFSTLDVTFNEGDLLFAQPRAMLSMTTGFDLGSRLGGASGVAGVVGGFKSVLSGESFATATYRAKRPGERLSLAPTHVGDIQIINLRAGEGFFLARGSYLAHENGVVVQPRFAGFKGWISKKGVFLLHVSGEGRVCVASYGAIVARELSAGELLVVDNDFVVAFSDTLEYELRTATSSLKDSMLSGEGLVNRYRGPGQLFYQTRARQRTGFLSSILSVAT